MDEEYKKPIISELLRFFASIFTPAILVMSLTSMLVGRYASEAQDVSTLFALDGAGMPFSTIFQIVGFSFVLSVVAMMLFSERFSSKIRFIWRILMMLLATLLTFSIFTIIFKWFPINEPLAWLGLILCTIVCFILSFGLTLLKLRLEGKNYEKLLAKYKASNKSTTQ